MAFTVHAVMPGVWHIVDCMGVCMTLLEGENAAMLVDTGYGIEDVADFMRHMTDLPLTVFLTHNHHDHAMGARCFPETYMLEADMADWRMFTNDKMRRRVLTQAIGKNLTVDEKTFLAGEIPLPKVMKPGVIDLGGLTAEIIEAPGHTPGSAVVYVPERKLLLSGDDWNPCTWLFFPQALGLREYRSNMRGIQQLPFEKVLCPHREALYDRWMFDDFFNALTDGNLRAAEPVNIAPENPAAGGVERHGPDLRRLGAQHPLQAVLKLVGGLIGKCNGDDAPGGGGVHAAQGVGPVLFLRRSVGLIEVL